MAKTGPSTLKTTLASPPPAPRLDDGEMKVVDGWIAASAPP